MSRLLKTTLLLIVSAGIFVGCAKKEEPAPTTTNPPAGTATDAGKEAPK